MENLSIALGLDDFGVFRGVPFPLEGHLSGDMYIYVCGKCRYCISLMCIFRERVKGQNVPYRSWDPFTSKVHHVNRYPPHAAPKPGRVSDGLTEAEGGSGGWTSFAKVTMMAIIG